MIKTVKNDSVGTPKELFHELDEEFHFTFDPCPFTLRPKWDGLRIEWGKNNFVNPPYSNIAAWLKKGVIELKKGKLSVFLITAKTNTLYWKEYVVPYASEVRFITERIKFNGYKKGFPLALSLVIFDPKKIAKSAYVRRKSYSYISFQK